MGCPCIDKIHLAHGFCCFINGRTLGKNYLSDICCKDNHSKACPILNHDMTIAELYLKAGEWAKKAEEFRRYCE